jgi:uncharacterized membrane protein HdeD (DUF308 family)
VTSESLGTNPFHGRLREASNRLFWFGIMLMVLGVAAFLFPILTTLAATALTGGVLLVSGLLLLFGALSIRGTGPFFGALLFSIFSLASGCFLLFQPLAGAAMLTLLLGIMFMLQGASELVFGLEMRPLRRWTGMLISGIASLAVALVILLSWPAISIIAVGVLLGVNFIATGFGYIAASRAL